MIQILITDDHAIVRSGLKQIFQQVADFEVVGEASNGSELLEILSRSVPDVLLMDLDMPGISGSELIERIRVSWPGLPLLIDSPGWSPAFTRDSVNVRVPFDNVSALQALKFDGVTAALRVNASLHAPLLCVAKVFKVASGDLSLPGQVDR